MPPAHQRASLVASVKARCAGTCPVPQSAKGMRTDWRARRRTFASHVAAEFRPFLVQNVGARMGGRQDPQVSMLPFVDARCRRRDLDAIGCSTVVPAVTQPRGASVYGWDVG
jgi:hypothetical protein